MKRGALLSKGVAAAITLAFMALVRPDPEPTRVEAALVSILIYETVKWCIWYMRKTRIRRAKKQYITVT